MHLLHRIFHTNRPVVRTALLLAFLAALIGMFWVGQFTLKASASGTYTLDLVGTTAWDGWWCQGTSGTCNFTCDASNVGRGCYTTTCLNTYQTAPDGSTGNIWVNDYTCNYNAPGCTPSTACAANTCEGLACSDGCGGQVGGTKNCNAACTASNVCGQSNSGTMQDSVCSASAPALPFNYGWACNSYANSCGQTSSGTTGCDGVTCNAGPPPPDPSYYGAGCTSAPNNCGNKNSGIMDCNNTCNAVPPADDPSCNPLPDVTAGTTTPASASLNQDTYFFSTISNIGTAAASNFKNTFEVWYTDPQTGDRISRYPATPTPISLAAGGNIVVKASFIPRAQDYRIRFCADNDIFYASTVNESDEGNNCGPYTYFTPGPAVLPDLAPSPGNPDVKPNASSVSPGTSQSYVLSTTNSGTGGTGTGFNALLQKSSDCVNGTCTNVTDAKVGTASAMNAGTAQYISLSYAFPQTDANTTQYVRICVDKDSAGAAGAITESNENNNCSGWTAITVTAAQTPTVTSCTPSSSTVAPNQDVTWTVTTSGFNNPPTSYQFAVTTGGVGNPAAQTGSSNAFTTKFSAGSNYTVKVIASNGTEVASGSTCTPVLVSGPASTCGGVLTPVISAQPTRGVVGTSADVTYGVTGYVAGGSCVVSGPDIGGPGIDTLTTSNADSSCNIPSTPVHIPNVTKQSVYSIVCGASTKTTIVNVIPRFDEF